MITKIANTMYKKTKFILKSISYLISQQIIHPRVPLWQIIVEALSHRFSVPTSKEYICKKCDKDLLEEIMPMNTVASWIWLTSNEPQQKCIHCNIVCTEKFLTFNKTKYGQNTIVSQMIENDAQNIICNKCHNAICRESLVTCLICTKTVKKVYIEIWSQFDFLFYRTCLVEQRLTFILYWALHQVWEQP